MVGIEPRVGKVKVGLYKAVINGPRWWQPMTVDLPAPVRGFVVDFDRGRFPQELAAPAQRPAPAAVVHHDRVGARHALAEGIAHGDFAGRNCDRSVERSATLERLHQ